VRGLFCGIALLLIFSPSKLNAFELGTGISAIEEGDDRFRPGILLDMSLGETWRSRIFYYGRKYGPITEQIVLVSAYRYLDVMRVFNTNFLRASVGGVVMNERTELDFKEDEDEVENNFNLGAVIGVHTYTKIGDSFFIQGSMESHIFLAGMGGVLMANGRKQMISLASGVVF